LSLSSGAKLRQRSALAPPPKRRDSAASRQRLLTAAAAEFAAHGFAGARVDRIAAAAQANKGLIYIYFGDKDGLFDAVLDSCTAETVCGVPIDAADLPGYAGRLFDYYHYDHPHLLRLVTWARLDGRSTPAAHERRKASYRRRAEAIRAAQRAGTVTSATGAPQILDMIESLAVARTSEARGVIPDGRRLKRERTAHRQAITEAVRRIVQVE
jgi:AcrR family transcriptional regulator